MALSVKGIARKYLTRFAPFSIRDLLSIANSCPSVSIRTRLESIARGLIVFDFEEHCNDNKFGGTARYLQIWTHIIVRIRLLWDQNIPVATQNNLMNTWGNAIQTVWSNKWGGGHTGESTCKLTFEVQWTDNHPHHRLDVFICPPPPHPFICRANSGRLFENSSGNTAAHEFGHLLGKKDEYTPLDPDECPNRNPVNTGTIMDDPSSRCFPERLMIQFANSIGSQIVPIPEYSHNPTQCT